MIEALQIFPLIKASIMRKSCINVSESYQTELRIKGRHINLFIDNIMCVSKVTVKTIGR